MAVSGMSVLLKGIADCFDFKKFEAEKAAHETSVKALRQFQAHQFSALHEPDGTAKADTAAMKSAAKAFVAANQGGAPVVRMGVPWINRSFRAARTVYADYGVNDTAVYFNLYHTMSYGAYLELGRGRRFAILEPIVRGLAPEFLQKVKKIYGK